MNCKVCHSAVCTQPHSCDDLVWMVPVIQELALDVHLNPVEVRESLDEQMNKHGWDEDRLTDEEFFLMWKAAELLQKWRG